MQKTVAIQGTLGSYSEEAALKLFGRRANLLGFSSFFETFQALLLRNADYAVIPVRNTIIGEIKVAVDFLNQSDLRVVDEVPLQIQHVLAGTKDARLEKILAVRSHVEALRQCRRFFELNPWITRIIGADTAGAIRRVVADGMAGYAAIGSRRAVRLYGAKILLENVADRYLNQTTFYLVEN